MSKSFKYQVTDEEANTATVTIEGDDKLAAILANDLVELNFTELAVERIEAKAESEQPSPDLEEARKRVIQDIVDDEANFAPYTVSGNLFSFFKWLQDNTDTFDPVMVELALDTAKSQSKRPNLKFTDDEIKGFVNDYLMLSI